MWKVPLLIEDERCCGIDVNRWLFEKHHSWAMKKHCQLKKKDLCMQLCETGGRLLERGWRRTDWIGEIPQESSSSEEDEDDDGRPEIK
jgi:hypothetical protein